MFAARRGFLTTLAASLLYPVARALGFKKGGVRLYVNGLPLELPDQLHLRLEVAPEGVRYRGPVILEIVGGKITVQRPDGPAFCMYSSNRGSLCFEGNPAALVENRDPAPPPKMRDGFRIETGPYTLELLTTISPVGLNIPGGTEPWPLSSETLA